MLTGYTYWENSDSEPLIKETYETISTAEGKKVIEKGMDGKPNEIKYYNAQNLLVKRTYYDNNAQKPTGRLLIPTMLITDAKKKHTAMAWVLCTCVLCIAKVLSLANMMNMVILPK